MDRALEAEVVVAMTKRIVALLYSLADLAERAADRSPAIRCLVLGFLRLAESAARELVIRDAEHFGASVPERAVADRIGAGAADAMRLARRFRELALTLERLVTLLLVKGVRIAGRQAGADLLRTLRQATRILRSLLDCIPGRLGAVIQPDTS